MLLCPLHGDRTPSLSVDDDLGLWYCHGCHEGGDIFSAVMATDQVSFTRALLDLADRCGLKVELRNPDKSLHDRASGRGIQDGQPVRFVIGPEQEIYGTLEQAAEAINFPRGGAWLGLLAGVQAWTPEARILSIRNIPWPEAHFQRKGRETEPKIAKEHRPISCAALIPWPAERWQIRKVKLEASSAQSEKGRQAILRMDAATAAGWPAGMAIGGDGKLIALQAEAWGIGGLIIAARDRSEGERELAQLPPALRALIPCFIGIGIAASDPKQTTNLVDDQLRSVASALGLPEGGFSTCGDLDILMEKGMPIKMDAERLARGISKLRPKAIDKDLFHATPSRMQAILQLISGLSPEQVREAVWQDPPISAKAIASMLGGRAGSADDLMLASAIQAARIRLRDCSSWEGTWPLAAAAARGRGPAKPLPLPEPPEAVIKKLAPDELLEEIKRNTPRPKRAGGVER